MAGRDPLGPALHGDRLTAPNGSTQAPARRGRRAAAAGQSAPGRPAALAELGAALEHDFRRPELLERALTHQSATEGEGRGRRNFERLEFLGDRVLGLVVADLLMAGFPDERVGELARRHAALVRAEALTRVARRLDLGARMTMARSEAEQGGREKPRTLADCCEAVIAALYLDGGLEAAERMIRRHWLPMMDEDASPPRDAKTALQEWTQARGQPLPEYTLLRRVGPAHAPVFHISCAAGGLPPVRAEGRSRRAAEQAAARLALERIGEREPDDG